MEVNGVDFFQPNRGEVGREGAEGIAGWFIDTELQRGELLVRHAYFLGTNKPYKARKTNLEAEGTPMGGGALESDVSGRSGPLRSGRIAGKVMNHLGGKMMRVFRV